MISKRKQLLGEEKPHHRRPARVSTSIMLLHNDQHVATFSSVYEMAKTLNDTLNLSTTTIFNALKKSNKEPVLVLNRLQGWKVMESSNGYTWLSDFMLNFLSSQPK